MKINLQINPNSNGGISKFVQINYLQMKSFTITIPDNKENIFIEMMKSINFVEKIQVAKEIEISEEHKRVVMDRLKAIEEYPENSISWKDIEQKINF